MAKRNHLGLVFEPAINEKGLFAGERKGSGKFSFFVRGKKAHVGRAFKEGQNAIVTLSRLMLDLNHLNDEKTSITVNVGLVEGGSAVNVVPDNAVCHVDVRIASAEDEAWILQKLKALATKYHGQDNQEVLLYGAFNRAPKILTENTIRLYQAFKTVGSELGQTIEWVSTGGCCDGNNLSKALLPNIDTLGVRGGELHSEKEYIILDSLVERTQLTSLFLIKLAQGELGIYS